MSDRQHLGLQGYYLDKDFYECDDKSLFDARA